MVSCKCLQCGNVFEVKPSRIARGNVKYCSKTCFDLVRLGEDHECLICGKSFYVPRARAIIGRGKYCSYACMGKALTKNVGEKCHAWKGKTVKRTCQICEKEFWFSTCHKTRNEGKYCSNECRHKAKSRQMRGERNPQYGKVTHSRGMWVNLPDGSKIWLRSSYEVRTLQALMALKIAWKYEPKSFPLNGTGYSYRPDFLIDGRIWWEVKGYMRSDARERLKSFLELYPNESLKIISIREIELLEHVAKHNQNIDLESFGIPLIEALR